MRMSAFLGCFCFSYMFIFRRILRVIDVRVFSGRRLISHSLILDIECEFNDLMSTMVIAFQACYSSEAMVVSYRGKQNPLTRRVTARDFDKHAS